MPRDDQPDGPDLDGAPPSQRLAGEHGPASRPKGPETLFGAWVEFNDDTNKRRADPPPTDGGPPRR